MQSLDNSISPIPRKISDSEPLLRVCVAPFTYKKEKVLASIAISGLPISLYRQWYCYGDEAKLHASNLVTMKRAKAAYTSFKGFFEFNFSIVKQILTDIQRDNSKSKDLDKVKIISSPYYKKADKPYWPFWIRLRRGKGYMPFHADLVGLNLQKGESNPMKELFANKLIKHEKVRMILDPNPESLGWEGEWSTKP